jgi:hypothetical protein
MLSDEALRGARELGDPAVLGRVLALRFESVWAPGTYTDRLAETAELADIAVRLDDRRLEFFAARFRSMACWEGGRPAESDEHLSTECRLAVEIGQPYLRWVATLSRAGRLLAASRLGEAEAVAEEALRIGSGADEPDATFAYGAQLIDIRRQQGRCLELLPVLQAFEGVDEFDLRPAIAMIHCEAGFPAEARAAIGELLDDPLPPPRSYVELHSLVLLSEVAAMLEDAGAAQWLYERMLQYRHLFHVSQVVRAGPLDHHLGLLATAIGDIGIADDHFAAAATATTAVPLPYWAAETEVGWARALLRRRGPGDLAHARDLLDRATKAGRRLGFAATLRKAAGVRTDGGI